MSDRICYWNRVGRVKDMSLIKPERGIVLLPLGDGEFDIYQAARDGEFMIISRYGEVNAVKRNG